MVSTSLNGHGARKHGTVTPTVQWPVLVLNQNYEPLNVCSLKRALVLVLCHKAEMLEGYDGVVHASSGAFEAPSVIRLFKLIRRPRPKVKLSRREIFARDSFTCQYCGTRSNDLTIDHVVPRSRGGQHTWTNVVTACRSCNHRKGGKSLQEARLRLDCQPDEPRAGMYYMIERRVNAALHDDWLKFLPGIDAPVAIVAIGSSSD